MECSLRSLGLMRLQLTLGVRHTEPALVAFQVSASEHRMDWRAHIWIDPERMHGTPCMRGTRIPVYVILDNLAGGETPEMILEQYPTLEPAHIPAAIAYAAALAHERVVPIRRRRCDSSSTRICCALP